MLLRLQKALCGALGSLWLASAFAASFQLTVEMYNQAPTSPEILDAAAVEAARVLRTLPVRLDWLNCSAVVHPAVCESVDRPTDIRIRLLPRALLEAKPSALGMAMWSESGGSAALFFDRALSFRTQTSLLPQILGRAMAHEVVHLLLGTTAHADLGLMRSEWSTDDLRMDSNACMELTSAATASIRKEAERRYAKEHGRSTPVSVGFAAKPKSSWPRP